MSLYRRSVHPRQQSHKLFTIGSKLERFDQNMTKNAFFHQQLRPFYDVMQKENDNFEFVQGVYFEFMDSFKNIGMKYLLIIDDSCEKICYSKKLSTLLLREDAVDWVMFTLGTTCFIKANLGETLSSKSRRLFSSNLHLTWCKSTRLVHSCASDQNYLIGIETQRLYPTVNCWLTSRLEQRISYVFVQTPYPLPQCFISRTGWNNQCFCTKNS